ncbi:MAG: DUF1467 family protein [Hyphomicrobiales bacterium]|nr:MAG: DUF1467 family protein [Hyphomicrobiales bacterium]
MSFSFGLAIYFVLWWTVLFAVLPLGVRTQGEAEDVVPGTPESAPLHPRLIRVAVITTIVSTVLFGGTWAAVHFGLLDLNGILGRTG